MASFKSTQAASSIIEPFPSAELLKETAPQFLPQEIVQFVRLWLTEGIPYAFQRKPIVYEAVRDYFANLIQIDPKAVTVVGSARLGYSLTTNKYGKPFDDQSDLDLLVVSSELFGQFVGEFEQWHRDFRSNRIQPSNPNEQRYWSDNANRVPSNVKQGFIDGNRVPLHKRYPTARAINEALFRLKGRVNSTSDGPKFKKVSVRVYKDWPSVIRRLTFNLKNLIRKFG
jgi:hypothetical protein